MLTTRDPFDFMRDALAEAEELAREQKARATAIEVARRDVVLCARAWKTARAALLETKGEAIASARREMAYRRENLVRAVERLEDLEP